MDVLGSDFLGGDDFLSSAISPDRDGDVNWCAYSGFSCISLTAMVEYGGVLDVIDDAGESAFFTSRSACVVCMVETGDVGSGVVWWNSGDVYCCDFTGIPVLSRFISRCVIFISFSSLCTEVGAVNDVIVAFCTSISDTDERDSVEPIVSFCGYDG